MKTKSEQLEICRTCTGLDCRDCQSNEFVKIIQTNLKGVHSMCLPPDTGTYFGHAPCQTCEDKLAGDRYKVCGTNNKDNSTVEFVICIDCFGYLFN